MPYTAYIKAFSSYLARTFYPVNVMINVKNLNNLEYKNRLFSISYNSEFKEIFYISPLTDYNHKYSKINLLNTPESFIKQIIDNNNKNHIGVKFVDDKIIFNTCGIIPLRHLDMIADFTDSDIKYNKPNFFEIKLQEEYYLNKIINLPDYMLFDIYKYAEYLSVKQYGFRIQVLKAPEYSVSDEFLQKYYVNSFRCPILHEDAIKKIINRTWHSGDGDMSSPSTKIFFKKSRQYNSLNKIGYDVLFSSSGGINMSYCSELPWFDLKLKLGDRQTYYDLSGQDMYSSREISTTELVILEEILKKEKAEFISDV